MRIAILWTRLSGYFNKCLQTLNSLEGVELFLSYGRPSTSAPFNEEQFCWMEKSYRFETEPDEKQLMRHIQQFDPQCVLVSSWHIHAYRLVLRKLPKKVLKVLCMDNQWLGTFKQWIGVFASSFYLHPIYDRVFLPGERQVVFAKKLGFKEKQIWRGLYSCDQQVFSKVFLRRNHTKLIPRKFIYVGRLSQEKGIDILVEGYRIYQSIDASPWPLKMCGTGPLKRMVSEEPGIHLAGFVQPESLPDHFLDAGCLVLPSIFEPWGVVIHEAVSAGLTIICTSACGASVHLVRDGYNGYIVEECNPAQLAHALLSISGKADNLLFDMSANSYRMSLQYQPSSWATHLFEKINHARSLL